MYKVDNMADNYTCVCEKCGLVVDNPCDLEYDREILLCEFCRDGINSFNATGIRARYDINGAGRGYGFADYDLDVNTVPDFMRRIGE